MLRGQASGPATPPSCSASTVLLRSEHGLAWSLVSSLEFRIQGLWHKEPYGE